MSLRITSSERVRRYEASGVWGDGCLHDLLAESATAAPGALALVDAPDREAFAFGPPTEMTNHEAADAVERLSLVFAELGLEQGDLIAIQLPQIVEAPLAILAALRSGLVACLLPPLWGAREVRRALEQIAPRAILAWDGPETPSPSRLEGIREVAAALPSVRFVLAVDETPPDGIIPLGAFAAEAQRRARNGDRVVPRWSDLPPPDPNDIALVTWPAAEPWPAVAHARSHNEIKAAGLAISEVAGIDDGARLLCPYPLTGFPALGTFLAPWLLRGGTLAFHRAFDLGRFREALKASPTYFTAVPARIETQVIEAIADLGRDGPAAVGLLRDLRLDTAAVAGLAVGTPPVIDILNLGDMVLHGAWRQDASPLALPKVRRKAGDPRGLPMLETHLAPPRPGEAPGTNELFLRSPMTPSAAVGGERGVFSPLQDADGFVAAGLSARTEAAGLVPLATPTTSRLIRGGLALPLDELKALYGAAPGVESCTLEVHPDPVMGQRVRAILFARKRAAPTADGLLAHLRKLGAGPHQFPDDIRIVTRRRLGAPRDRDAQAISSATGLRATA